MRVLRGVVILVLLNEGTINTCLHIASEIVVILKLVWFFQKKKKKLSFSPVDCHDLAGWKNVADSFPIKTCRFLVWFFLVSFHKLDKRSRGGSLSLGLRA